MAHEVERAVIHGQAWHDAGKRLDHLMTVEEALHESGLDDWMLKKYPMVITIPSDEIPFDDIVRLGGRTEGNNVYVPYDGRFGHLRRKTGDWAVLGDVGPHYNSIDNEYLFDVFKLLCDKNGLNVAKIESAGSLRGGARVWVLLSLPDSGFTVGNRQDLIIPYLLATNAHDGTETARFMPTTVRVVCMNTLNAALGQAYAALNVRVRHTGDIEAKMEAVQEMMAQAAMMFGEYQRIGNELDERVVTEDAFAEIMNTLFPPLTERQATTARIAGRNNRILQLTEAINAEVALLPQYTATGGGDRQFSYWTLLNGITRYTTHGEMVRLNRKESAQERNERVFESQVLGGGAEFAAKATRSIMELSGVK